MTLRTGAPAMPQGRMIEDIVVPARAPWSARMKAGESLRLIDIEGQQAVDFLCFGADPYRNQVERYHMANTIKIPCQIFIGKETVLYSQFARPMMTVTDDSVGGHDTVFGCCSFDVDLVRYGAVNGECCQRNLEREMARRGLGPEHVVPNVNFFMNVPVAPDGRASITESASRPGDFVDLRAEMDLIVVLSNCPEALNPAAGANGPSPIRAIVWQE